MEFLLESLLKQRLWNERIFLLYSGAKDSEECESRPTSEAPGSGSIEGTGRLAAQRRLSGIISIPPAAPWTAARVCTHLWACPTA